MTLSFKAIADEIDIFDADVAEINEARKKFWGEIRDQYPARDVRALKLAIKARRKRRADLDGEEAFDARVFEILTEIEAGTIPALTRGVRDDDMTGITPYIRGVTTTDLPPHDSETGEITDTVLPQPPLEPAAASDNQGGSHEPRRLKTLTAGKDRHPIPENDEQHGATVKPTSPMPAAINSIPGPASSQEPCTHGSGAVQDRCESTAPPIPQPAAGLPTAVALAVERIPPDVTTAGAPIPPFLERGNPACVVGRMQ